LPIHTRIGGWSQIGSVNPTDSIFVQCENK
jgi:hypothetical protein